VTSGTTIGIATYFVARIAQSIAARIARITVAVADDVARTAIGNTSTVQAKTAEQVSDLQLRCGATIVETTRIARITTIVESTRIARIAIGYHVARAAILRSEQVSQASAHLEPRSVANDVARIAIDDDIARIASDNCIARITVVELDTADQSLETGKQSTFHDATIACSARVDASRIAGAHCKTLNTHHEGDSEGSHQNSDFHWVISPFCFAGSLS
jgi:hypothetical protein